MRKNAIAKAMNLIGVLLMVAVVLLMAPLTLPKLFGIEIYGVLSESMTPTYAVGGVVYVKETDVTNIAVGDVITYRLGSNTDKVMTHRVVEAEGLFFVTKGDNNNAVDSEPVSAERVIGKVVFYIPGFLNVAEFVNSTLGRCVLIMLFASAFILWVVADMIAPAKKGKKQGDFNNDINSATGKGNKCTGKQKVNIVQIVGVVFVLGAVVYLGTVFLTYRQSGSEYTSLEKEVFTVINNEAENSVLEADRDSQDRQLTAEEEAALRELTVLSEENPDMIGWIKFDNLELSYPIMQSDNNDYYLNHTFSGESNSLGSIFMEASNSSDFNDSHTIIYGHNAKNRSMFGSLKTYKREKDFYPGNEYFTVYTLDKIYRYKIFAYYDISMYGEIYNVNFTPGDEFDRIIDNMIKRSYYNTGVEVESTDKIITLSTCSTQGNRFVVNGVRVSEK